MILVAGGLLGLGLGASLLAGRLRVPGLVIFLAVGMVLGSDVLGLIAFDDFELARTIGIIALVLILFEGGFAAGWDAIRPVLAPSLSLATVGTLVTALVTGFAAVWILDLDTLDGLLLGAVVSASDSAAIFSVLRGSNLRRRLARTLEGESGFNDPVAILLTIGFIEWIDQPDYGVGDMLGLLASELAIGGAVGLGLGWLGPKVFMQLRLASSGLYPVASMTAAALAFGLADVLHGSGFLAVYLAALGLGTANIPAKQTIGDFHAGLGWVSQIALFTSLGLLVFPSTLDDVAWEGLLIAAVLMFVARPLAAALSTLPFGYSPRETLLVGWAGLRGAIPIVLATFPVIEGIDNGRLIFDIAFFAVLASTLLQGATIEPLARKLRVTTSQPAVPRPLIEVGTIRRLGAEVVEFPVGPDDALAGRLVNEAGLPREALVSVIVRGEEALLPRGSTRIEAGDRLHILVRGSVRDEVEGLFDRWRDGPVGPPPLPPIVPMGRPSILTVRPWAPGQGDPGDPSQVHGVDVRLKLRVRRGEAGALVQLVDGRLAVTGDGVAAAGGPRQLFRWARDRARRADDPESRAWWQEVAGVVAGQG